MRMLAMQPKVLPFLSLGQSCCKMSNPLINKQSSTSNEFSLFSSSMAHLKVEGSSQSKSDKLQIPEFCRCSINKILKRPKLLTHLDKNQSTYLEQKMFTEIKEKKLLAGKYSALSLKKVDFFLKIFKLHGNTSDFFYHPQYGNCGEKGYHWVISLKALQVLEILAKQASDFNALILKELFKDYLKHLLEAGLDINEEIEAVLKKPLHIAASHGCEVLCEALIELGAGVNDIDNKIRRLTPLHYAAMSSSACTTTLLINLGADVNAKDSEIAYEETPLHMGALNASIIRVLAANKANVNVVSKHKVCQTPLQIAVLGANQHAVNTLLVCGADPLIKTRDGKSVKDLAIDCLFKALRELDSEEAYPSQPHSLLPYYQAQYTAYKDVLKVLTHYK